MKSQSKTVGLVLLLLLANTASAELLNAEEPADAIFEQIADALHAYGIDVLSNLNDRQLARSRSFQPRLGRFPDLPDHRLPLSPEIAAWEDSFETGKIGGLAIIENYAAKKLPSDEFWLQWTDTHSKERIFISFSQANLEQARKVADVVTAYGHAILLSDESSEVGDIGKFYATAARRLAIDSREARRLDTLATEFSYLGKRVHRNSNSIFRGGSRDRRIARQEPPKFLKETLGDEFSESTVREIIVPGGVALGETAYLSVPIHAVIYEDQQLKVVDDALVKWKLPDIEVADVKALFDYVERSHRLQSDSIVDIDGEGRVKISSALRDTDVGYQIMHADTLPFEYVGNLPVTKSVVIDTEIDWIEAERKTLGFVSDFEVRFLSADNVRLAQTRVALEYEYKSATAESAYIDKWGRDKERLRENMNYEGLGVDMAPVAVAAGWAGLLRLVLEQNVPFIQGRYEFMKLEKTGRETPVRY